MGRVSTFLKRGKIFDIEIFADAARRSQAHQVAEREKGNLCSNSKSRRPKYQAEVQSLAALILDKHELPEEEEGLDDVHEDVLDLAKVGWENYKEYFFKKIRGIPTTSIKLTPAFITKKDFMEFNKIENKTKEVIAKEIKLLITQVVFEDEMEKSYYESKAQRMHVRKDELIDLYNDIRNKQVLSSLREYEDAPNLDA